MYVLSILAPVLIIVILGKILHDSEFLDAPFFTGCTKIVFWVGLPALLVYKIGNAVFDIAAVQKMIAVLFLSSAIVLLISIISSRFMNLSKHGRKTFMNTSFHCNISYIGLPVIFFALEFSQDGNTLTELASMAAGIMVLFNNSLATIIMNSGHRQWNLSTILHMLKKVFLSPIIIACIIGFIISIFELHLPYPVNRVLLSLGNMSLPLALIGVGARLEFRNIHSNLKTALIASLLNALILPLLGFLIGSRFSLTDGEMLIGLIFLASPGASATYIYAREMDGDALLASKVVLLTTLISIIPLSLILYRYM